MLHVCSSFVWIMIKMQWLPQILNGKSTDKALFCLYEDNYFICVIYLIWSQSDLNEENRSNQNQQESNNTQVLY